MSLFQSSFGHLARSLVVICGVACAARGQTVQSETPESELVVPRSGLMLERAGRGGFDRSRDRLRGRVSFDDPLADYILLHGCDQLRPQAGDELTGDDGTIYRWSEVELDEQGRSSRRSFGGSHLYLPIESDRQRVMILEAVGHSVAYFNGQPRVGNIYGRDYVDLPVLLNPGVNELLLRSGRGAMGARLYEPPADVFIQDGDRTLPDLIAGQAVDTWAAVIVVNATEQPVRQLTLAAMGDLFDATATELPEIPPLSFRKVGFRLRGAAPKQLQNVEAQLVLTSGGEQLHTAPLTLSVKEAEAPHRRTFISELDGSVQYYALRPAVPLSDADPPPAVVLSCHGAAVEAINQASAYSTKSWLHLVAPTNRRPYGFDWEDFGRLDALEVLQIAKQTLPHDPARIYLTGHSMGGHGTWHLGVTHPDLFAAIGPSAGWISRATYGRSRRSDDVEQSPIERLLARAANSGDTIGLADNLRQLGVYILHGEADRSVPVSEARQMAEVLKGLPHHDWDYHEEPGQPHWWNNDYDDTGNASVDWPDMFDLFARHALPPVHAVRQVAFTTANPAVSSRCRWLRIAGQLRHDEFSRVDIHTWPNKGRFQGTTDNVAVLALQTAHLRTTEPISVELDGQKIENIPHPAASDELWLRRDNGQWTVTDPPAAATKGPHRYGPIKNEMRHQFLFVYGTAGTPEENAWSYAKARYDAETYWYRGNASVDIVADVNFSPGRYQDRGVVLYGHADSNAAWSPLLRGSPVQVSRGRITIGDRELTGDDLAAAFVRPRPDSDFASVAVVSGSGPIGQRLADQLSFFTPFVRYPDCLVQRVRHGEGQKTQSEPVVAGYFGLDWSVTGGEFVWADGTE